MAPSLVISVFALLFTVGSFWWIQVRRGRLHCYAPNSYAGAFTPADLLLSLPLVLHNTGAAPIVVLDFRLRLSKTERQFTQTRRPADAADDGRPSEQQERALLPISMSWRAIQPELQPARVDGGRKMPSPFPVDGRRAVERFIEFGKRAPNVLPLNGPYTANVDIKLAHRRTWRPLLTFDLHTELVEQSGQAQWLVRTNDPDWEP